MTEKELDKILASVLGKEPSVEKERPPRKKTGGKGARAPKKDHTEADREAKANASIPKNEEKKERKGALLFFVKLQPVVAVKLWQSHSEVALSAQ